MRPSHLLAAGWSVFLPTSALSCSSTTYTRAAPLDPPAQSRPEAIVSNFTPPPSERGRVLLDASPELASAVEESPTGALRLACATTPCVDDVLPGGHRYWLIPRVGVVDVGRDGVVRSPDGSYPASVNVRVDVARGETVVLRVRLGRTEVHRGVPPGRAIGWTLFATGLAIAILGVVTGAAAQRGSSDAETATGLAELGAGVLTLGGALFLSNLNDDVTVRDHPGSVRPWIVP